jgi:hypothetical protein
MDSALEFHSIDVAEVYRGMFLYLWRPVATVRSRASALKHRGMNAPACAAAAAAVVVGCRPAGLRRMRAEQDLYSCLFSLEGPGSSNGRRGLKFRHGK